MRENEKRDRNFRLITQPRSIQHTAGGKIQDQYEYLLYFILQNNAAV